MVKYEIQKMFSVVTLGAALNHKHTVFLKISFV